MLRKSLTVSCIALLAAVPVALSACGGDDDESPTTAAAPTTTSSEATTASGGGAAGGSTVKISETEFKLDPSDPTAKPGTVTFDVSNKGGTAHNLEIEGDGVEQTSETINPGDSTTLTVNDLKPGTYEIYCAIPGHREQGMEGELTVQ